jgi:hypothetical protein
MPNKDSRPLRFKFYAAPSQGAAKKLGCFSLQLLFEKNAQLLPLIYQLMVLVVKGCLLFASNATLNAGALSPKNRRFARNNEFTRV